MERNTHFINSLTFQMGVTAGIFYHLTEQFFAKDLKGKISVEEYIVMDAIMLNKNADEINISKTVFKDIEYVKKIISKLHRKKFVTVRVLPEHKVCYELTREGSRVYQSFAEKEDFVLRVLSKFLVESELSNFTKTLMKIRNILISYVNSYEISE